MKLFEIGDGLKSILVSGDYYSDWENDENVMLYKAEDNGIEIRITVISIQPKDASDPDDIFNKIIRKGKEKGYAVRIKNDKSYFYYSQESKSTNDKISTFFYEIGYKWNYILISITSLSEIREKPVWTKTREEIEQFIPSITQISIKEPTIFEPKYADFATINKRTATILGISEDEIDMYHENGDTLLIIQKALDENKYKADQIHALQSLGIAFGDYIRYVNPDYHWAVVRDEYGRDICLQYQNLALTVFPMTMISKRVEDGENVNIKELLNGLVNNVEEMSRKGGYKELEYNY
ncbi:MAG: DUF3806 domain-containing protein [Candidatus Azobacteroides sp.]|nr:DUF3806 domain-containing protein [Candidatus Azobacteroides sp.]